MTTASRKFALGRLLMTRGVNEEQFLNQITQRYAYHKVKKEVKKRGYTLATEEVKEDQKIHLRIDTWQ